VPHKLPGSKPKAFFSYFQYMKITYSLLVAFLFMSVICMAQGKQLPVEGKFVGQFTWDRTVAEIEVKADHEFVVKTYDHSGNLKNTSVGEWQLEGKKLLLTEATGRQIVLEKYEDMWYVVGENGYTCEAKFYQNKSLDDYLLQLKSAGC
jgi:hypothetical protein